MFEHSFIAGPALSGRRLLRDTWSGRDVLVTRGVLLCREGLRTLLGLPNGWLRHDGDAIWCILNGDGSRACQAV